MPSLTDIIHDFSNILLALDENGGEYTDEIENRLDELELDTADKVDSYDWLIAEMKAQVEVFKSRADDNLRAMKACKAVVDRLKNNLKYYCEALGVDEIKGHAIRYKLSNTKPRLEIDESELPEDFFNTRLVREPAKDEIRKNLEQGRHVPGAVFVPNMALRRYTNTGVKKNG